MTNATVRSAWKSKVMDHLSVKNYTERVYDHDVTEESTKEQGKLLENTIVNAVSYTVSSSLELRLRGAHVRNYRVEVKYFKQYDVDGDYWKSVVDFFELVQNLVLSELGGTWDGTVDYYVNQEAPPEISLQTVCGRRCWVGRYIFLASVGL